LLFSSGENVTFQAVGGEAGASDAETVPAGRITARSSATMTIPDVGFQKYGSLPVMKSITYVMLHTKNVVVLPSHTPVHRRSAIHLSGKLPCAYRCGAFLGIMEQKSSLQW
jgi:hypothetical protein